MVRLCSSSLVRQEILKDFKIPFIVGENGFDEEQLTWIEPLRFAYYATIGKYQSAFKKYGLELPLLIVDSVVSCNGVLQRKAQSIDIAREFLNAQSGGELSVITCAILQSHTFCYMDLSQTSFKLGEFCGMDLEKYLQSGNWRGKAGAVMVEGFHKNYILKQCGTTHNAMGLNIEGLLPFLKQLQR